MPLHLLLPLPIAKICLAQTKSLYQSNEASIVHFSSSSMISVNFGKKERKNKGGGRLLKPFPSARFKYKTMLMVALNLNHIWAKIASSGLFMGKMHYSLQSFQILCFFLNRKNKLDILYPMDK